ncbi:hypothetical protein [Fructilactobacillus fructivorans]|uniref:N-acetyltransferase n=1 Tax=Fructilactobacillus fructivorans TaxID=1614 RepID=A0A0C1LZT9_9LACO|nr:hypothetical protein [Fructilactobacillus fructivorans]KID42390.1 hypothetical protein LfDm3_0319 [Fructilactobacillus fructivorans]MCT0150992.1 GNAT family acetyltransferase [Fructilactobacillus fructivorans]MCT2867450.1 GNAT family acetyltransferase [Fructilactobacillus fructivorans]MCT2869031.1 GNAT family acetyltransferase [Fructilactobacillus fructivorans]MCT2873249.1 GNAT family acetyltransferase [Fructilactobacillus fructivorans]
MEYKIVSLGDLLENYKEIEIKKVFNTFQSKNKDVEHFLKSKSIEFQRVGLSRTTLVFSNEKDLIGYFSISTKPLTISKRNWNRLSHNIQRKLNPMDSQSLQGTHEISSILLGQLSKNNKYCQEISGEDLLSLAYDKIRELWKLGGGRILYVEVDDNPHLDHFYCQNGFRRLEIKDGKNNKDVIPYKTVNKQNLYVKKLSDI